MRLQGSTEGNLMAALRSSRRLRASAVHADTLQHWTDLLQHADRELAAGAGMPSAALAQLAAELKIELASRGSLTGGPTAS